jgi:ABC-type bacteriocin/lantibiotic exporter with double-glycine peptidase domain
MEHLSSLKIAAFEVHNSLLWTSGVSPLKVSMGAFVGHAAFSKGWSMTLVLLAITPLLVLCGAGIALMTARLSSKAAEAYAEANTIAQDALASIRTVTSFNAQKKTLSTYSAVRMA